MSSSKPLLLFTVTNDLNYDQRMIRICSTLQKQGYQVRLIGRKKSDSAPLHDQRFDQKRLFCFFQKGKWFYLEYNIRLFFYLFFHRYDLACAIDLDTILPVFLISSLKRKKWVYDAHEYFTEVPEVINRKGVQKMWESLADWIIPKSQFNYTVGPALASIFSERYAVPFEIIRNVPFKKSEQSKPSKTSPFTVIYQGALNEGRGIEASLQAFQYLENAQFWIVGEGDLSKELRMLSKKLKLDDRVKFWGYQRPEDLKKITEQAHLGLNLLENKGLSYYYSLANKFFDYIQAGLPSLNMDFPEYRAIVNEFPVASLLEDLNPKTIAKQIDYLANSPEQYLQMKQICQEAAQVYHWEKEKETLIQFYQEVLK